MSSSLESFREKFQTALADHERRVLLDMLTDEVSTMTLGELGELLTSELGVHLESVAATELFKAVSERAAGTPRSKHAEVLSDPRPTGEGAPPAQTSGPGKPRTLRTAVASSSTSAKTITDDVRRALEASPQPMSPREIRAATGHPETKVRLAVRFFLQQGVVRRSGVGRGTCYSLASRASGGSSVSPGPIKLTTPSAPASSSGPGGVVRRRPSQSAMP